jgi:tripartite-type tricarboxylate transporter receptor subunit TctC/enamine deaminase RidA (YjgF/YER057c/UK114 family)
MTVRLLAWALLSGMIVAAPAGAQNYPTRPITFVVPFAAGGLSDVPGRILAAEMQERIGQSIVVENRPGASGVTGATSVLRAEPDGYTLLVNALADVQNLHYLPVSYDPIKDFALIGMVTDGPPLVLIVNANLPYKSVADLIADARANPNKVSFGTSGPATSPAISVSQLNALAKTSIVQVPYRGSGPAAAAVVTGEVQGSFVFYSNARPLHDEGRVRALAIASPQRLPNWPEIPTMRELGFEGFDHRGFVGLAAPGKTPAPIIAFLNKHLNQFRGVPQARRADGRDDPEGQHAGKVRRVHAPRVGQAGGARQADRPFAAGAALAAGMTMAKISRINPDGIAKPFANYSHVVTAEGAQKLVFCAGQVAADAQGNVLPPDDFDAQAKMVMDNLTKALAAGGAKVSDVTKITIYIVNPHDVPKARGVLAKYFAGHPPGSTLCILRGLANPNFLLEIEAIAAV